MAIQSPTAELLLLCRQRFPQALDFLMIGRQWLRLPVAEAARLGQTYGIQTDDLADPAGTDTIYAEPLLQRMKLNKIEALDASDYEGAAVVHDLNTPLPAHLHGHCDWVFDGGSLEHVFDFPTAIRNCAALLRPGGLFITVCPVNNWMGHGFYQFSPELFFRVFQETHGFAVKFAALQVQEGSDRKFFKLRDPAQTGHRLQYNPPGRATLLFVAQKLPGSAPGILQVQQSDYSARWKDTSEAAAKPAAAARPGRKPASIKGIVASLVPDAIKAPLNEWRVRRQRERKDRAGMVACASLLEAWNQWK